MGDNWRNVCVGGRERGETREGGGWYQTMQLKNGHVVRYQVLVLLVVVLVVLLLLLVVA